MPDMSSVAAVFVWCIEMSGLDHKSAPCPG